MAGNYLRFPLFFGVDFIFGSIATMIAVVRLGMLPGVLVASAGGVVTLIVWQHPYALIIFVVEAMFVSAFHRRWGDPVRVDAAYWLLVGVPLVLLFYAGVMQMDMPQTQLIVLKQPLNGVFNAVMAALAMLTWDAWGRPEKTFNIGSLIQLAIFTAVLFPALLLLGSENRHLKAELEAAVFDKLKLVAASVKLPVTNYVEQHGKTEMDFPADRAISSQYVSWAVRDADREILWESEGRQHGSSGELRGMGGQKAIWLPSKGKLSTMSRWKAAEYRLVQPFRSAGKDFTLELGHAAAPVVNHLHNAQIRSMMLLVWLILLAGPLAILIGRILTRPITLLTGATRRIPDSLQRGNSLSIPESRITEVNQLAKDFRDVSASLQGTFAELAHLASHDVLTGTWNRRKILEYLEEEILRSRRYGSRVSVVLFDVDHFKRINDSLGHAVGDMVLVELTERVRGATRNTDKLGRWGGEEFLLILPQTARGTAVSVAEKIRKGVAESSFSSAKRQVTVSFGVAEFLPDDSVDQLLDKADQALYRAKSTGRDRVCE